MSHFDEEKQTVRWNADQRIKLHDPAALIVNSIRAYQRHSKAFRGNRVHGRRKKRETQDGETKEDSGETVQYSRRVPQ